MTGKAMLPVNLRYSVLCPQYPEYWLSETGRRKINIHTDIMVEASWEQSHYIATSMLILSSFVSILEIHLYVCLNLSPSPTTTPNIIK